MVIKEAIPKAFHGVELAAKDNTGVWILFRLPLAYPTNPSTLEDHLDLKKILTFRLRLKVNDGISHVERKI